jgi:hypothetical protein
MIALEIPLWYVGLCVLSAVVTCATIAAILVHRDSTEEIFESTILTKGSEDD